MLSEKLAYLVVSFFSLSVILTGCGSPEVEPEANIVRPVKLFHVSNEHAATARQFPAVVEPTKRANLTFRVSGKLIELSGRPSHNVQRGELLARLDDTDFKLRLDQANARYELAQTQFDRANLLMEQKLVSQAQFDETKAQLQVAKADFSAAKTALSYTRLEAPFAGTVSRLLVENHENIAAQQPIMELQVRGHVDVVIQVPEDVISNVRREIDYQPEVIFDSHPEYRFRASLREWDSRADPSTNSFKVVFSMKSPEQFNVLSGMTANVIVDMSQVNRVNSSALYIPATAIFMPDTENLASQQSYVWLYDKSQGKVTKQAVTIGELTNAGVAITSGIAIGDTIVTAGVHQLSEGQQVRPWIRERGL
ncbi:efflux transporter periplasmic adaptor subunit [Rheinheimera salexigens]|uniref:Efflux transporter periplasmic adaptor subunit n=1 Tax=Rheinheimera salexigens TaxID=1628148 RepID=A0A1E7Q5R1_9GAMM|nr:efflux transporter periplasmic adaptor subunit [Rheinheimera salexigens]